MQEKPNLNAQTRVFASILGGGADGSASAQSGNGGTPSWRSGPSPSPAPLTTLIPGTPLPAPDPSLIPRPLNERETTLVKYLSKLQFFLATAPTRWMGAEETTGQRPHSQLSAPHPNLNRFLLPNGEHVACVYWNGLYHITGTDIAFSRPVRNLKKFEEGVFSDLRNLKPGQDACLEEPKSPFLDLLFRNGCIRTQKKVFFWFSVPHDRLFLDALERDLKREKQGIETATAVVGEPARSFQYDPQRSLFDQFAAKQPTTATHEPGEQMSMLPMVSSSAPHLQKPAALRPAPEANTTGFLDTNNEAFELPPLSAAIVDPALLEEATPDPPGPSEWASITQPSGRPAPAPSTTVGPVDGPAASVLVSKQLFEGSRAYKQRRNKKSTDDLVPTRERPTRSTALVASYAENDSQTESDEELVMAESASNLPKKPFAPESEGRYPYQPGYQAQSHSQPDNRHVHQISPAPLLHRSQSGPPGSHPHMTQPWTQPVLQGNINAHSSRIFGVLPSSEAAEANGDASNATPAGQHPYFVPPMPQLQMMGMSVNPHMPMGMPTNVNVGSGMGMGMGMGGGMGMSMSMPGSQLGSPATSTVGLPDPKPAADSSSGSSAVAPGTLVDPDSLDPNARGFACPLASCGRVFKRLEHLRRHVRTHTQERPYACARCPKRFSRSDNLAQHVKTHDRIDRGERMKTEMSEGTEDFDLESEEGAGLPGGLSRRESREAMSAHSSPLMMKTVPLYNPPVLHNGPQDLSVHPYNHFAQPPYAHHHSQIPHHLAPTHQAMSLMTQSNQLPPPYLHPSADPYAATQPHLQNADWLARNRRASTAQPLHYRGSTHPSAHAHPHRYHPYASSNPSSTVPIGPGQGQEQGQGQGQGQGQEQGQGQGQQRHGSADAAGEPGPLYAHVPWQQLGGVPSHHGTPGPYPAGGQVEHSAPGQVKLEGGHVEQQREPSINFVDWAEGR